MNVIYTSSVRAIATQITLMSLCLFACSHLHAETIDVYFGSAGKNSEGIYHSTLNTDTGKLSKATQAHDITAAKFITTSPDNQYLYAVATQKAPDEPVVAAYKIEKNGELALLNKTPVGDSSGTHISVHPNNRFLITAQYGGNSVALFPIEEEGRVGERAQLFEHKGGSGVVPSRQQKPHPHWVGFSPDERFAFAPDLGKDEIVIYKVNRKKNTLKKHGAAQTIAGGGPRHMRFSVDGKFIYLLNELTLSVTTFAYDAKKGKASPLTTVATLSEATKAKEGFNSASEILVHPNGKFVFTGNRGHDSISAFRANPETGELALIEVEAIRGSWPRSISMDPSGRWLLAAGARSNTISVFGINQETGELTFQTGGVINVPEPITIAFGRTQKAE